MHISLNFFFCFIVDVISYFFRMPRICKNGLSYIAPPFLFYSGYFSSHSPIFSILLYWKTLPGWYWPPFWVITYEMVPEEVCGFVPLDLPVLFPTIYTWVFVCSFLTYYIGSWAYTHLCRRVISMILFSSIYETHFNVHIAYRVSKQSGTFSEMYIRKLLSI